MRLPRLEEGVTAGTMCSVVSVAFPRYIHLSGWQLIWRLMERVGIENLFLLVQCSPRLDWYFALS